MDKGLLISFTETTHNFDQELREWFVHEHIDERALNTPGFLGARFYESFSPGPKYFATYETKSFEVLRSESYKKRVLDQTNWSKKILPRLTLLDRMTARITIDQMHGFGSIVVTIRIIPHQEPAKQNIARTFLEKKILPEVLKHREIVGVCLAENMPEIANLTGNQARLLGAYPTYADKIEWIVLLEGYEANRVTELAKKTFDSRLLKKVDIGELKGVNCYHFLYGNCR